MDGACGLARYESLKEVGIGNPHAIFGVISHICVPGANPNPSSSNWNAYCAIGTIRYSCVDGTPKAFDGKLLYIKPRVTGTEPGDVLQYKRRNSRFPQESLVDQFFSESQFESYRALGLHILTEILGTQVNNDLLSGARSYLDGVVRRSAV